jgi:6-phosphogluconolactonase
LKTDLPVVSLFPDAPSAVQAAAGRIIAAAAQAIAARGVFHLGLSGGSTPQPLFRRLAELHSDLQWERVHVWWADERCVPPAAEESNYAAAHHLLLRHVAVQAVHRILGEMGCYDAADIYEWELRQHFTDSAGLDLLLLGMGGDGHIASLFPGDAALKETRRLAVAVPHNQPPQPLIDRVSLSLPAINRSRQVLFLLGGESKRQVLQQALAVRGPAAPIPAGQVSAAQVEWLLYDLPGFAMLTSDNILPVAPQV